MSRSTMSAAGRLARALADAGSLEEANDALNGLGVRTELDLERRPPEPSPPGPEPSR